mmetsp:Transcript_17059/g.44942  ORF Transcript_17059/g.44942 Transcript_17059/m.44942 type:complete len:86 (+) Transcript_17059:472-729(+)
MRSSAEGLRPQLVDADISEDADSRRTQGTATPSGALGMLPTLPWVLAFSLANARSGSVTGPLEPNEGLAPPPPEASDLPARTLNW